ncbi:unnamed protein product, partial [Sphacelaria rigidula]
VHIAAGAGSIESIELLVSAGFSTKRGDDRSRTPLHHAAASGRLECVSLLCTIARSTVASRTEGVGDTPLHLAIRSRSPACVAVILWHGGAHLASKANLQHETPIDIARSLGSNNSCLRVILENTNNVGRRRRNRGERTLSKRGNDWIRSSGLDNDNRNRDEIDIGRIMAVWERFFENAAKVYMDLQNEAHLDGDDEIARYGVTGSGRETSTKPGIQSNIDEESNLHLSGAWRDKGRAAMDVDYIRDGNGNEEGRLASRDECFMSPGIIAGENTLTPRRSLSCLELSPHRSSRGDEETHHVVFEPTNMSISTSQLAKEEFNGRSHSSDALQTSTVAGIEGGGWTYTDEARYELPRARTTSQAYRSQERMSSVTPLADKERLWIACWDRESKSIYYSHSKTGETTWSPSLSADGAPPDSSLVWDPESVAYYTVEDDGCSRWIKDLGHHEVSLGASGPNDADVATTAGCAGSSIKGRERRGLHDGLGTVRNSQLCWQNFESVSDETCLSPASRTASKGTGSNDEDDHIFHEAWTDERRFVSFLKHRSEVETPSGRHPAAAGDDIYTAVARYGGGVDERRRGSDKEVFREDDDGTAGFFEARDIQSSHAQQATGVLEVAVAANGSQQQQNNKQQVGLTANERHSPQHGVLDAEGNGTEDSAHVDLFGDCAYEKADSQATATSAACDDTESVVGGENVKNDIIAESGSNLDVMIFAQNSCTATLPAWMLWSRSDPDSPSYYINRETGETSWTLPQDAAISSRGWLIAWSEEHQEYFYVNEWSGRVTWQSSDL